MNDYALDKAETFVLVPDLGDANGILELEIHYFDTTRKNSKIRRVE